MFRGIKGVIVGGEEGIGSDSISTFKSGGGENGHVM